MIKNKDSQLLEAEIIGMSCTGCANSIKTYLEKVEGVDSVLINFTDESAEIFYNPEKVSPQKIVSEVKSLGYDLKPESSDAGDQEIAAKQKQKILRDHRIKIFTAISFSLIIMTFSMREHLGIFTGLSYNLILVILFFLSTVVVFWCGDRFLKGAYAALKSGTSDMNTLISMGTLASYLYSVVISFNQLFNLNIAVLANSTEVYYETAAMIITFILIGNYLEVVLKTKTQTSINKLKDLQAKEVTVIRDNKELVVPFNRVRLNDIVIIKTGDKVPVDGKIIEGYCVSDESAMTGESLPIEKREGDELISGSIIKNGFAKMTAEKVGKETMLSKVISLVKEASASKPKIQRLADRISAVFVPIVVIIAILTFAIWNFIIGASFEQSLLYAVAVLIIACPCALGLASPMAIVIGVGRAAENGILFNDVDAIENMKKINTICFDKTGTLTTGEMKVKTVKPLNGFSKEELLKYAYSVEKFSNHPVAKSIVKFGKDNDIIPVESVKDLHNESGLGISAVVNDNYIVLGNENLMKEKNYFFESTNGADARNNLFISINDKPAGIIEFEDTIKEESKEVVRELKEEGYELFMISGDNKSAAGRIAKFTGIENYSYKTLPDEKEKIISKLQSENKYVAMIGDGINDAPSLAKANIGIAVGTGTDIAIDTADVILVKGDLRNILKAIRISGKTVRIIKQNFFWAFFYNVIAIPAAAGVLTPWGIVVTPVMAAMLMAFSDVVTVIGNSLRLKYINIDKK
jgi:heavy metal translocating P-type ATPase